VPARGAYEDGTGVSIRGARLYFVFGLPGGGPMVCKDLPGTATSICVFSPPSRTPSRPPDKMTIASFVYGSSMDKTTASAWRDAPGALGQGGAQSPCILIHPGVSEIDAFDAGYVCLLKSQDPLPLVRALRSVVAGTTSVEPLADFSGSRPPAETGLRVLVAEDKPDQPADHRHDAASRRASRHSGKRRRERPRELPECLL